MASCYCHPSPSSSHGSLARSPPSRPSHPKHTSHLSCSPPRKPRTVVASVRIGVEEIASVLQNKVLVAATIASAVGQLSKPFTSAPNGDGFDLKAALRSGGMPSVHSAAVAAASTSLGLERGFSDSIFGISVVFAAIIMYDAQGVRREVGNHAKSLNALKEIQERPPLYLDNDDLTDSRRGNSVDSESLIPLLSMSENQKSFTASEEPLPFASSRQALTRLNAVPSRNMASNGQPDPVEDTFDDIVWLNESVGHTEIQVLAGAFLGFLVGLAIEMIL